MDHTIKKLTQNVLRTLVFLFRDVGSTEGCQEESIYGQIFI